jgi:hypothetical protein
MLKKKTVLILGAGASMPYGYPSGVELRAKLLNKALFKMPLAKKWLLDEDVDYFCKTFLMSGQQSIDLFLSRRGHDLLPSGAHDLEYVGKLGISLCLRSGRSLNTLFHNPMIGDAGGIDRSDHWYEYLWNRISNGVTRDNIHEFETLNLSIVTFNYDLSLENYLYFAARNTYGLDHQATVNLLKSIQIIHLYGQLCGSPLEDEFHSYEFDANEHWRSSKKDIESIRVIDEQRENLGLPFENGYKVMQACDQICFLGFGFDEINMKRLRVSELLFERYSAQRKDRDSQAPPVLCATVIGLELSEQKALIVRLATDLLRDSGTTIVSHYRERIENQLLEHAGCKSRQLLRRAGALM